MSDLPDVRLVVRRRCEVCEGTGEALSEDWQGFADWKTQCRGEREPEDYFLHFLGMDAVPPMKRECGNCEGGWVDGELAVEDLVEMVLARVPKSIIPRGELEEIARDVRVSITAAAQRSRGLADPDDAGSWLRVVQEGASALREVTELLTRDRER